MFKLRPPFKKPMIFLAGPETNHWTNKRGRMYLRAKDYFSDFEKIYGANGVLPSLDGADHFRLRKSLAPAYSRGRLEGQLGQLFDHVRKYMADWTVGDTLPATSMCRRMINAQISPVFLGVESQDIFDDLATYKERALTTHVMRALPRFMLGTPGMRRRAKAVDTLLARVQSLHTSAQRAEAARDLADDLLSLHASDPQFVPESNLRFALSAALIASVYLGDAFSFTLYAMASQPEMYAKIRSEADALFHDGDPEAEAFNPSAIDVTHRFLMECLRVYPIVPMSIRNVMNTCVVEDYELPVGSQIFIAQTATHYMNDVFPDPFKFDIDRYLSPRNEHHGPGYAPFGLGTHTCLGSRWLELQLAVNVLMVAHYFTLEIVTRRLQVPLQSPSVDEAEQEAEIPRLRAEARNSRSDASPSRFRHILEAATFAESKGSNMPDGVEQLNEDIIAASRILSREGLVQGFGHVSARIPDSDLFVITPRIALELVQPGQLVVMNLQGQVLEAPVAAILRDRPPHRDLQRPPGRERDNPDPRQDRQHLLGDGHAPGRGAQPRQLLQRRSAGFQDHRPHLHARVGRRRSRGPEGCSRGAVTGERSGDSGQDHPGGGDDGHLPGGSGAGALRRHAGGDAAFPSEGGGRVAPEGGAAAAGHGTRLEFLQEPGGDVATAHASPPLDSRSRSGSGARE